jgi:mannose-1-phosphate guanylyltransferase
VLGCRDLVVVARQDSVLVLPRARSQEVKRVVAELRRRGASQV